MRWLSWSLVDVQKEIGGAEIHALCVGHHLKKDFGVDFETSNKPDTLYDAGFDVIQTHGSALPKKFLRNCYRQRKEAKRIFRIHTLHGESLEVMRALGQWHRIGRWKALFRELRGCLVADLVLAVRGNLQLVFLLRLLRKNVVVIENGWDSADASPIVHESRNSKPFEKILSDIEQFSPFSLFVGRNLDPMKGFSRIPKILTYDRQLKVAAVPGQDIEASLRLMPVGPLSPRQLTRLYMSARSLIVPSAVEGLPLVLLEALAQGCPAVVSNIPAHRALSKRGLTNFYIVKKSDNPRDWARLIERVPALNPAQRSESARLNREKLRSWAQVARDTYEAAKKQL
ncbi:MAG: glycosyltransferase family 4 protein [Bdellovibrionota bacterium]